MKLHTVSIWPKYTNKIKMEIIYHVLERRKWKNCVHIGRMYELEKKTENSKLSKIVFINGKKIMAQKLQVVKFG